MSGINRPSTYDKKQDAQNFDESSTLQGQINAETTARQSADTTLQNNITAEASARASADTALDARVTALETTPSGISVNKVMAHIAAM